MRYLFWKKSRLIVHHYYIFLSRFWFVWRPIKELLPELQVCVRYCFLQDSEVGFDNFIQGTSLSMTEDFWLYAMIMKNVSGEFTQGKKKFAYMNTLPIVIAQLQSKVNEAVNPLFGFSLFVLGVEGRYLRGEDSCRIRRTPSHARSDYHWRFQCNWPRSIQEVL